MQNSRAFITHRVAIPENTVVLTDGKIWNPSATISCGNYRFMSYEVSHISETGHSICPHFTLLGQSAATVTNVHGEKYIFSELMHIGPLCDWSEKQIPIARLETAANQCPGMKIIFPASISFELRLYVC